jgi:hypothetical protein
MTVRTNDNELSLEQMSEALPDTPAVMEKVGHCWWHLIYAARGGNWGLAQYYLDRVVKLSGQLAMLRPKHQERLQRFSTEALQYVGHAIGDRNLARLEEAYDTATQLANFLHAESGYPYIKWVLPANAPEGLQLEPVQPLEPVEPRAGQPAGGV